MQAGSSLTRSRPCADLRDASTPVRSAVACLPAAGGRVASCARRHRLGSDGRWAWHVAVRCCAHSQSIAEQGDSHRSGEGGSIGMLQKSSSSGARVGEGSATESPAACEEPSAARWVTPGISTSCCALWLDSRSSDRGRVKIQREHALKMFSASRRNRSKKPPWQAARLESREHAVSPCSSCKLFEVGPFLARRTHLTHATCYIIYVQLRATRMYACDESKRFRETQIHCLNFTANFRRAAVRQPLRARLCTGTALYKPSVQ